MTTKRKKRVLVVTEFSQLATGFSTYFHYILPLLYNTGKYEIAELAIYGESHDPRMAEVPWKVYPNMPDRNNPQEKKMYDSNPHNVFGLWKFDRVAADFQPDAVINIGDPWNSAPFIINSPFRNKYKFIYMPTCDGERQKEEWMAQYPQADILMTYSRWAKELIEIQSGGQITVFDVASPGVDTDVFKPLDKDEVRKSFGLKEDILVFQTVMRNQPRKLFTELFKTFAKYLQVCKDNERDDIAKRSFLYCHSSSPDVGYSFPQELKNYGVGHKVLFTYVCHSCGLVISQFYNGDICSCPRCKKASMQMPNTVAGVDRPILSRIMNCADAYIQYSVAEGYGMSHSDAKACGIPVFTMNHSAMTEQATNGGGILLKNRCLYQEPLNATYQWRALPDNDDTAQKMFDYAASSQEEKDNLGKEARECALRYDWKNIAKIWEKAIDTVVDSEENKWLSPPQFKQPNMQMPNNLSNEQFLEWCYRYVLQQPELIDSYEYRQQAAALNSGFRFYEGSMRRVPVTREDIVKDMMQKIQNYNGAEQYRLDSVNPQQDKGSISAIEV